MAPLPVAPVRRSLVFATDALEPLMDLAGHAERRGFDRVWTTEYVGRDAIARAQAVAAHTTTIEVGTGIAYAFARSPLAMAALVSDVQKLSGGRFGLGLSPGTRGVRRWYEAEFEPPAPRLVEYVEKVRAAWARSDDYVPAPIFAAAFNPIMTRHVAKVCDALLLHPLGAGRVHLDERLLPAVRRGAAERDEPPTLVAWQVTSVDDDEEVARARAAAQLAFYFSTPSYSTVLEGTPWEAVAGRIQEGHQQADSKAPWRALASLVPDDMLDEFAVAGTPATLPGRIAAVEDRLRDRGVSELAVQACGVALEADEVDSQVRGLLDVLARPRAAPTRPDTSPGPWPV